MSHPGVDLFCDPGPELCKYLSTFMDPLFRDVKIGIRAAQQDRCSRQVTGIAVRVDPLPDQTAAQNKYTAVTRRKPDGIVQGDEAAKTLLGYPVQQAWLPAVTQVQMDLASLREQHELNREG